MKFLVVLFGALSATSGVPVENDYVLPAAPVVVATPVASPVVEPVFLRSTFVSAPVPLAPSPVRFLSQPIPAPLPAPFAPVAPLVRASPVVPTPFAAPVPVPASPVSSQFHAQDELGGFSFGYQNLNSARTESRSPDGVTRGSYNYVDANGVLQQVEYIADPINGFRVAGTNLPVAPNAALPVGPVAPVAVVEDTADVVAAKAEFQRAFDEAVARNAALEEEIPAERKKRQAVEVVTSNGYGLPAAPVVVAPAPVIVSTPPQLVRTVTSHHIAPVLPGPFRTAGPIAPVAPFIPGPARVISAAPAPLPLAAPAPLPLAAPVSVSSQFQAQDEAGGYSFGYNNAQSTREESRSPDGVTTGSYSYIDANGVPQTVNYIADALGFRVAASNLPVAPVA